MRTSVLAILALCLAAAAPAPAAAAPDQARLVQGRVELAGKIFETTRQRWQNGQGTLEDVVLWSTRWLGAERDRPTRGRALKKALEAHRDRMKAVEAEARKRVEAGTSPVVELEQASYFLVEAELWLARGK